MRYQGLVYLAIMFLVLAGCSNTANPPEPTATPEIQPIDQGMARIAFVSDRDGNYDIFVMNADGTEQRNLTNHPSLDTYPSWSPDGKKIAFYSNRNGNYDIYTMNLETGDVVQMTTDPASDHSPAWSPDGKKIAFVSERSGRTHIWMMDADGSNQINITSALPNAARWPTWSPDAKKIAYITDNSLYVANADGSKRTKIVDPVNFRDGFFINWPLWSKDNTKLTVVSNLRNETWLSGKVCTIGADGKQFLPIIDNPTPAPDERPTWSPDVKKIAFASLREDNWDIYVLDVATKSEIRLTGNAGLDSFPAWEPRGLVP